MCCRPTSNYANGQARDRRHLERHRQLLPASRHAAAQFIKGRPAVRPNRALGAARRRLMRLAVLLASLLLTACAGTSVSVQKPYEPSARSKVSYAVKTTAKVTDNGLQIFRERLEERLRTEQLLGDSSAVRTVEIDIVSYRVRHGATRALVGVMAGADNVRSSILIKDTQTGSVVGQFAVESKNPTATSSARLLIEGHADAIVDYIASGRK